MTEPTCCETGACDEPSDDFPVKEEPDCGDCYDAGVKGCPGCDPNVPIPPADAPDFATEAPF